MGRESRDNPRFSFRAFNSISYICIFCFSCAFSDARRGERNPRARARSIVHACGSQGYTHVRAHAHPCAAAEWKSRFCARATLRNEIATLSPSDTGSTLKARSQEGIETFGVTGRSRHTSLPGTRGNEEVIRVRGKEILELDFDD